MVPSHRSSLFIPTMSNSAWLACALTELVEVLIGTVLRHREELRFTCGSGVAGLGAFTHLLRKDWLVVFLWQWVLLPAHFHVFKYSPCKSCQLRALCLPSGALKFGHSSEYLSGTGENTAQIDSHPLPREHPQHHD